MYLIAKPERSSVLASVFETFSQFRYKDFCSHASAVMPMGLLERVAAAVNIKHYQSIEQRLLKGIDTYSKNPEVYLQISKIRAARSARQAEAAASLLRLHLGLLPLMALAEMDSGLYRMVDAAGAVYRVERRASRRVRPQPWAWLDGWPIRLYYPAPGLFSDFVSRRYYPSSVKTHQKAILHMRLSSAIRWIANYSTDLFHDFASTIRWIVLTPDYGDAERWSYSFRLAYFGGVFVNAYRFCEHALAEALIHEYYHHRLWQWWFFEPIQGTPSNNVHIISPISGRRRSVEVMIQALLIYVEVARYYCWLLRATTQPEDSWSRRRLDKLLEAIPLLHSAILAEVDKRTTLAEVLRYVRVMFTEEIENASSVSTHKI